MAGLSRRHLPGVLILGVVVMALAVFTVATTLRQSAGALTPAQVTGSTAPVGKRVVVAGVIGRTMADRRLVLVPSGAKTPQVEVVLGPEAPPVAMRAGVAASFAGVLSKPGLLEDARPVSTGAKR